MRLVVLLLLAVPLPFVLHQDPVEQDPVEQDPTDDPPVVETWEDLRERKNDEMMRMMEGAWSLVALETVGDPVPSEDIEGTAVVADGYISIIIHARARIPGAPEGQDVEYLTQANISQFDLAPSGLGEMRAATLIGHSDFSGDFGYEPYNDPREFQVEVHEHDLMLRRTDGSRLVFRRLQPGRFPIGAAEKLDEEKQGGGF